MLSAKQIKFRNEFLSPLRQRLYYLKSLPMALLSGIKLIHLDEKKSISEVPFRWINQNPFNSMYFAVLSMAAELSTAAPVLLAIKGREDGLGNTALDKSVAIIIVEMKAEFEKKAQSKIEFSCMDYENIVKAVLPLKQAGDAVKVSAKTEGRDVEGNKVATFYFTWSFKVRS